MSCGVPVISTRCFGPQEYVIDGRTGYLTGFDPEELAARLSKLYYNRKLLLELGQESRKLVLDLYSIEAVRKKFWDFFAQVYGQQ
jgi:glycosyltransferase involved in cell wall biosynthesis